MKRYRQAFGHWEDLFWPPYWLWLAKDPRRWITDAVPGLLRDLREFAQRGMYGFADTDIPELGPHLCNVMVPALARFREWHWAYPGETPQEWDNMLAVMVAGWEAERKLFSQEAPSYERDALLKWEDELEYTAKRGLRLFAENLLALWY